jgi:DNA-directed RNA polymerase subunit RPC12/RpoP
MADFTETTQAINLELACKDCGALLKFKPGTQHLACEYCGAQNEIAQPVQAGAVKENSLEDFLANNSQHEEQMTVTQVKCDGCHAINTFDPKTVADRCAFCGSPLVVKSASTSKMHRPEYVLPFGIDGPKASANFKKWLSSLWFAPNDLKEYAAAKGLNGVYLPFWTFDCSTDSNYTGQRGEDYTVSETYTANENGKNVTRTRNVTKTRWHSASGRVSDVFDDILVEATQSLNKDKLRSLEPWDLNNLVAYDDKYLSGFRTESFALDLKSGYVEAKSRMTPVIESSIRRDIGGDRQMIHSVSTTYHDPTFKHILLPVWLSAYRYNNKVYQFLINARTGEVQGERPWSTIKIVLAVLGGLTLAAVLYFMFGQNQ